MPAPEFVSIHLGAICEDVQPLVLRVPGVHCFQGQLPKCVCYCFSLYYVLLQMFYSTSARFCHLCNGWGLLLISNFVFVCSTFCKNPFCIFKFHGLFSYVFQYWSPRILSSFSCSSTAFSFIVPVWVYCPL